MERWNNRVVLVTGASSGIGETICKLLCQNGMKVVGCARQIDKLERMKIELPWFYPFKCDLQKEDEINQMFQWIEEHPELGSIDVCIPNAGLTKSITLLDGSMEQWRSGTIVLLGLSIKINLLTYWVSQSEARFMAGNSLK